MLTTDQLRSFKKIIQNRINEVKHELQINDDFGVSQSFVQHSTGELSNYDNHPGDTATELYEREKDISLSEHMKQELTELTSALQRIGSGKYGVCSVCGGDIAVERLVAIPTASTCIEHSPSQNTSHDRPVEESTLNPPFGKYVNDTKDANFFDAEDSWQRAARYGTSETPSDFNEQQMSYDSMYIESHEPYGYVEEIETFLSADLEGKPTGVIPNKTHEHYEAELDDYEEQVKNGTIEDTDLKF
ncbi:TraR/DksA C4-type zinc finger protein [Alkalihalobacillus macyae]|uniref:TraR/DksA C4-type zinc finger protein n=1 Tax=Guptibacillus hwajinpoensis TaxID=208199 RepID=UPI00273C70B3|nr:TraR/DksA C4-type zinc finger protein [Alkalihalobacillus macyae]MDP4551843.1 TraR/DksA C4-type zinc finger protein [Alkalihalobacillus macyae]